VHRSLLEILQVLRCFEVEFGVNDQDVYVCPRVLRSRRGGREDKGANIVGFGKDGEDIYGCEVCFENTEGIEMF